MNTSQASSQTDQKSTALKRTAVHIRNGHHRGKTLRNLARAFTFITIGAMAVAQTNEWTNPAGGSWSTGTNWALGVPTAAQDAVNTLLGATITFDTNSTVNSVLANSDLRLLGGSLAGTQASAGSTIQVNSVLSFEGGFLSNFTIQPGTGGSVTFNGNGNNGLSQVVSAANLTFGDGSFVQFFNESTVTGVIAMSQEAGNGQILFRDGNARLTLSGAGRMRGFGTTANNGGGGTLDNDGVISADVTGKVLRLGHSNTTGSGVFEARNGGTLAISTGVAPPRNRSE